MTLLLVFYAIDIGGSDRVNAFTVELFKANDSNINDQNDPDAINSLEDADALIGGNNLQSTASGTHDNINFSNAGYGHPWGNYDSDDAFPGIALTSNMNSFAVRVTSELIVNTPGEWTFLTNSDDGVRLRIDGTDVIVDNSLHPVAHRWETTNLSAGSHDLELVFFENYGIASLELTAAQGSYPEYNSNSTYTPYNSSDFQLLGNTLNGVEAVPFEFSPSIGIVFFLSIMGLHYLQKKITKTGNFKESKNLRKLS